MARHDRRSRWRRWAGRLGWRRWWGWWLRRLLRAVAAGAVLQVQVVDVSSRGVARLSRRPGVDVVDVAVAVAGLACRRIARAERVGPELRGTGYSGSRAKHPNRHC